MSSSLYVLDLETTRATSSTRLFELASLGAYIWLDTRVCMRICDGNAVTKVGQSLARFGASQQDGVGSLGCLERQLIKRDALSTGGENTLACIFRESQSADR